MKFHAFLAAVALLLIPLQSFAEGFLGIDGEEATSIGIYIKDLATGEVIVDHNSQMALTPASVMKAVTTASALSINGADGRFSTSVVLKGSKDKNVFNGDIVIDASADPTLESENFKANRGFCDSIAARLKKLGIDKITGTVIVKESLKNPGPILQWELEDIAWPYGAALFGFNYRDNTTTVTPALGKTDPEVPGMEICLEKASGNDLVRGVYSDRLMVFTRDPNDKRWTINASVPDPAAMFAAELRKVCAQRGISIANESKASANAETTTLYTHRSPRYGDIMRSLMVRSDNLFAEGMLRTLAPEGTRKAAINREKELWASRGINTRYTIINDGSGLTRANRLSAHFLGDVLEWMAKSEMCSTYTAFFPRAGKDGTLRGFLAKSPLKGQIALKTGSVSSVQCYAGYKLDNAGHPTHVVVMMINGFFCPRRDVREACENLLSRTFTK